MNNKALVNEIRHRRAWLAAADDLWKQCEQLTAAPADASLQSGQRWRRAAKFYGMAAEHYRWAGLGLRAIAAWQAAATCFAALGLESDRERCTWLAATIPTYATPGTGGQATTARPASPGNDDTTDDTTDDTHEEDR